MPKEPQMESDKWLWQPHANGPIYIRFSYRDQDNQSQQIVRTLNTSSWPEARRICDTEFVPVILSVDKAQAQLEIIHRLWPKLEAQLKHGKHGGYGQTAAETAPAMFLTQLTEFWIQLLSAEHGNYATAPATAKHGRDAHHCDVAALAEHTNGYTGSEIEQCVVDAMYDAFDAGSPCDQAHLAGAIAQTVPLSRLMADDIKALRKWADGRTRPASDSAAANTGSRKLTA